ncbi:MAG: hypothetical protein COV95_02015 [Candidatus Zambryskibacteria bacterium CG11_big_fil_rev_8_21_14_0_20_40_24]|uniref:Uncharacterized protein n=1 Tax=Candidatus Zambryskibacteria bacterium CG11_big_fil_rev_8_21_14_0_20_40_24 TaxID=1975116 RepID=A0A2H0K6E4_9BACT|nr:MAG: hypothetical protein COV95_02015 [Candidatus Zambryskibacteria bacterium CG11_big_fil_rev_8_21_14_0_20_40_24]
MDPQAQENQNNNNPVVPEIQHKSTGPLIGIIIIIAVIILGGLYFWGQRTSRVDVGGGIPQAFDGQDISALPEQSNSADTASIEADLNAVDFENLGNEFDSIEAESQTAQ